MFWFKYFTHTQSFLLAKMHHCNKHLPETTRKQFTSEKRIADVGLFGICTCVFGYAWVWYNQLKCDTILYSPPDKLSKVIHSPRSMLKMNRWRDVCGHMHLQHIPSNLSFVKAFSPFMSIPSISDLQFSVAEGKHDESHV